MPVRDSLDKIIGVYLANVCSEAFEYKGTVYKPRPIHVSPLIFRGFKCFEQCGGCCPRFSLDYLPSEKPPYVLEPRTVLVNRRNALVLSDMQQDHADQFCRNLDKRTGRCTIHGKHPFSCDFELMRFVERNDRTLFVQKLYGRGWAMQRVDGQRGAKCEMTSADSYTVSEVVRKLERLKTWADHFSVGTRLPTIIAWAKDGPHAEPLYL